MVFVWWGVWRSGGGGTVLRTWSFCSTLTTSICETEAAQLGASRSRPCPAVIGIRPSTAVTVGRRAWPGHGDGRAGDGLMIE